MNKPSALPDYLSEAQCRAIGQIVGGLEFLPLSILFWRHDRDLQGISPNRVIPDDFFYILTKGTLDCRVGDHQRRITAGEFIMIPAGVQHSVEMPDDIDAFEVYSLHMHLYDETHHRFLKKLDSPFGALSDPDAWVARLSACTCLMGRSPEAGGAYMEQLVGELLIEQLLQGCKVQEFPVEIDNRIAGLLQWVRREPARAWTVAGMAESCHLSVSRFRELFATTTGSSPKKYVQKVRLSLARSLLMTKPALTVEHVAEQVGISDAHYFHAIYKKRFGETPRQRNPYQQG